MPPGLRGDDLGKITLTTKLFEEKTAREKSFQYDGVPSTNGSGGQMYMTTLCQSAHRQDRG